MDGGLDFIFQGRPVRVVFGKGKAGTIRDEIARAGLARVFLVCAEPWQDRSRNLVGDLAAAVFDTPAQHTPVDVTERALARLDASEADGIVAFGGGSAIGLGKALALRTGLPLVAVPTTYAGSEMTPLLGQTEHGVKTTLKDEVVRPSVVIYDPIFSHTMPLGMSVSSGLNAIAHAAEALYAPDRNPVIELVAAEGVRAMAAGLDGLIGGCDQDASRASCLYGAWLCGHSLGAVSMGLHHKLCHTLGGLFDLPHAEMHAILLPYSLAYNAPATPGAMARLEEAFRGPPLLRPRSLLERASLPLTLSDIGMPMDGVAAAVDAAMRDTYDNPRELTADGIQRLLRHALVGDTDYINI